MRALEIIAGSWPIAVMFVALCAGIAVQLLIRRAYKDKRDQREYSIASARDVTPRRDH